MTVSSSRLTRIAALLFSTVPLLATAGNATTSSAVHSDQISSLRNLKVSHTGYTFVERPDGGGFGGVGSPTKVTDRAAQSGQSTNPRAAATPGLGFDGVGQGFSGPQGSFTVQSAPPDTSGAVGKTQYVQMVNSSFAVFDKTTGNAVYGPVANNTLFSGFGGACETQNDGDGIVQYDKAADRWVLSQFAVPTNGPYYQCIAVSQTSDATGAWNRYAFQYSGFNDYPKMGIWPDGYYVTFNMFDGTSNAFLGAQVCAMDRAKMLTGAAATQQCVQMSSSYGGVLPSDLDGSTPPPAGSPNYLINVGSNNLNLWKFHVDWTTPSNTSLSAPTAIPVTAFNEACSGGTCIPQPGTTTQLDSLADRMMFRAAYRNFGDHEALVTNHSVQVGNTASAVRWYEIRNLRTSPTIFQQSSYSPDSASRWMGSVAMDKVGNMAVGYSVSSSSINPSIRYSTRLATDAANTLSNETTIVAGGGSQLPGSNASRPLTRWGDYSQMSIDPVDDCTFWYTGEYLKATGSFNWSTRVSSFKLPSCSSGGNPPCNSGLTDASAVSCSAAGLPGYTGTAYTQQFTTLSGGGACTVTAASTFDTAGCTPPSNVLSNGVPVTGLSLATGTQKTYTFVVPTGATSANFATSGGTGDVDLYIQLGSAPTTSSYLQKSDGSTTAENITLTNPTTGTYYVLLDAYSAPSGFQVVASYSTQSTGNTLTSGVPISGIAGALNSKTYYKIVVPAGRSSLTIKTSGGPGDADLYVQLGSNPTTSSYLKRSWTTGNTESITITAPAAGTYYIMINGYAAYSGLTLVATD